MTASLTRRDFLKCSVVAGISVYIAAPGSAALAALFEEERLRPLPWDAGHRQDPLPHRCHRQGHRREDLQLRHARTRPARLAPGAGARDAAARDPGRSRLCRLRPLDCSATHSSRTASSPPPTCSATACSSRRSTARTCCCRKARRRPISATRSRCWSGTTSPASAPPRRALKFRDDLIRWGAKTGPLERDPWAAFRYVRVGGATPFDDDRYSSLKDTPLFPLSYSKKRPQWPQANPQGGLDAQGAAYAGEIAAALEQPGRRPAGAAARILLAIDRYRRVRTRQRQCLVRRAPPARCIWSRPRSRRRKSPKPARACSPSRLAASVPGVKNLVLHPCYTVGYGSKDHNPFPFYALMAGLYGDGRAGAPGQRPLRAVPGQPQAPQLPHPLPDRGRSQDRQVRNIPGRHGR